MTIFQILTIRLDFVPFFFLYLNKRFLHELQLTDTVWYDSTTLPLFGRASNVNDEVWIDLGCLIGEDIINPPADLLTTCITKRAQMLFIILLLCIFYFRVAYSESHIDKSGGVRTRGGGEAICVLWSSTCMLSSSMQDKSGGIVRGRVTERRRGNLADFRYPRRN